MHGLARTERRDLCDRLKALADINGDPVVRFVDMQAGDFLSVEASVRAAFENGTVSIAADTELDASAANSARMERRRLAHITARAAPARHHRRKRHACRVGRIPHSPEPEGPLQIF